MNARPFVKWAGGKTHLLPEIRRKYPKSFRKYCEPFLGGGAVFFDIIKNLSVEEVLLNDLNSELINVYLFIKNDVGSLIKRLKTLEQEFLPLLLENRKLYYSAKRDDFNSSSDDLTKASLFIFLNKTCFNGLFRVNSKGKFNVPFGDYKRPLICDEANLLSVSELLQTVSLKAGSYENCLDFIDEDTFVYLDPPYRPISKTSSFNSYTKSKFDDEEQKRLKKFIDEINKKEAHLVLSNSDPKAVCGDVFFDNLYENLNLHRIEAMRAINSKGNERGKVSEILVSNF